MAIRSALVALVAAAGLAASDASPQSPLGFTVKANDGKDYALSQHKGQVVMIVNVASKCGLTPQYAQLQALHEKYKDKGFAVLAFPANNFKGQEPGSDAEIRQFCTEKYNVTFPLMAKVSVGGDDIHPLYAWLTEKSPFPGKIEWNFGKFLVGRDGNVAARFAPKTKPDAPEVTKAIEEALAKPAAK